MALFSTCAPCYQDDFRHADVLHRNGTFGTVDAMRAAAHKSTRKWSHTNTTSQHQGLTLSQWTHRCTFPLLPPVIHQLVCITLTCALRLNPTTNPCTSHTRSTTQSNNATPHNSATPTTLPARDPASLAPIRQFDPHTLTGAETFLSVPTKRTLGWAVRMRGQLVRDGAWWAECGVDRRLGAACMQP
jgi:hypothetical protein